MRFSFWRILQCCCVVWHLTTCHLIRDAAGVFVSDAVDLYNSMTRAWSTARLSVPRRDVAAASVGNKALFAGGGSQSTSVCRRGWGGWSSKIACMSSVHVVCG
jgi:hypothetical protein